MKASLQDEIKKHSDSHSHSHSHSHHQQQEQAAAAAAAAALKCPRCDSSNTKFCYYNNYSLTQPRHFCKTCRRYWTKGGALRNVPIGGGCRKNKKHLKSSNHHNNNSSNSSSSSSSKLFTGIIPPSIDFLHQSFPRSSFSLDHHHQNNYSFMGLNTNNTLNIASSIESLSCVNQDLHWKLQQQRLGMIFGDHEVKNYSNHKAAADHTQKFLQPILFQNLELQAADADPKQSATGDDHDAATTEWFFGNFNSYDHQLTTTTTTTTSPQTNHNNIGGSGNGISGSGWNNNGSSSVQGWEDLHHFTALP